jgi:hypothetical protein
MAVGTPTSLTSGTSTANQSTAYTTASVTPTANVLQLLFVVSTTSAAAPNTPTITSSGLTWTPIANATYNTIASPDRKLSVFWATGASPGAGAISIDHAGQAMTGVSWSLFEVTGANLSSPIVQSPTNANDTTQTSASVTLAAFSSAGNLALAGVGLNNAQAVTHRTNWTEIHDVVGSAPATSLETQYRQADDDASASWGSVTRWAMIGLEIAEATGGAFTLDADPGSYSLTGSVASLLKTSLLAAVTGVYTLTGVAATLTYTPVGGYSKGYNFRAEEPFVEDQGDEVQVGGGGLWSTASVGASDSDNTVDRRLAGSCWIQNTGEQGFYPLTVPAPGNYRIKIAAGSAEFGSAYQFVQILDGGDSGTPVITIDRPAGFSADEFFDASDVSRSTTDWPTLNVAVDVELTATNLVLCIGTPDAEASFSYIAHVHVQSLDGGAFTIEADPGAYTLTGSAALLEADRLLSVDPGTYDLIGTAADLLAGYRLSADPGSYTLTGSAAELIYTQPGAFTIAADPGTYALTGSPATLTKASTLAAEPGVYSLTGAAALFPLTRVLLAESGVYVLFGYPADLTHGLVTTSITHLSAFGVESRWDLTHSVTYVPEWRLAHGLAPRWTIQHLLGPFDQGLIIRPSGNTVEALPGSYSLTGGPASLIHGRVLAAVSGVYTLTGVVANLLKATKFLVDPGLYTLTGADAALFEHSGFLAESGVYAVTGSPATLLKAKRLVADPGTYALTGSVATLRPARRIAADPGAYSLTGSVANLLKGKRLTADPGLYTLTGRDAGLIANQGFLADAGAYNITGSVATFRKTSRLAADPDLYTLTGQAATTRHGYILAANPGTYTLTGNAASLEGSVEMIGTPRVQGFVGMNNPTTPNSQFDLRADYIVTRNPSNGIIKVIDLHGFPTLFDTNNINTSGPVAGGRDQSGAFGNNTWIHFYYIQKDDNTFATISSLNEPEDGPNLPSGYAYWTYACSVRKNNSGNLMRMNYYGSRGMYDGTNVTSSLRVLENGVATTFTAVDLSGLVPPFTRRAHLLAVVFARINAGAPAPLFIRLQVPGGLGEMAAAGVQCLDTTNTFVEGSVGEWAIIDQEILYRLDSGGATVATGGAFLDVYGFTVPNGGE